MKFNHTGSFVEQCAYNIQTLGKMLGISQKSDTDAF